MTHDERIEAMARAIWQAESLRASGFPRRMCWDELGAQRQSAYLPLAQAALAAAGVGKLEEEVTRLRDAIAHAIIMLQTGMPQYDAHDVLDVLREVMGK